MYKKTVSFYFEWQTNPSTNITHLTSNVDSLINTVLGKAPTYKKKIVYKDTYIKQDDGTYKKTTTESKYHYSWLYNGTFNQALINVLKNIVDTTSVAASTYLIWIAERNNRYVFKYGSLTSQFNPIVKDRGATSITY